MTEAIVVLVTCGSRAEADALSQMLLENRLAACINRIDSIESVFHWKGAIDRGTEVLLLIKTQRERFADLAALVRRHHSYETPEIIALPIIDGDPDYLTWLQKETQKP
ncbi:MAG: divalent-cation tolerance protein CutA [candidate division KSB1 bacterium]|nr:divalent-cation tolerance protein CutA [candidate division KSB1 bacterium]